MVLASGNRVPVITEQLRALVSASEGSPLRHAAERGEGCAVADFWSTSTSGRLMRYDEAVASLAELLAAKAVSTIAEVVTGGGLLGVRAVSAL